MELKNKTIVVTGASSGIGMAAAEKFAQKGSNIVLVGRRKEKLLEVEKKLSSLNVSTLVSPCDVSDKQQVEKMSHEVFEKFDTVDVLVNNAGFAVYGTVLNLSIEEIESQMATNYFGMIYTTKNFLPKMLEQHSGHIVNVASVAASFGLPGIASYCASKFAMLGFSEGLQHELKGTGVGVTVVSPIMVRTNFFDHPSFEKISLNSSTSISAETVAKAIVKAANSKRLEIIVPPVVRGAVWAKHTFPFFINPFIGSAFKKQLHSEK